MTFGIRTKLAISLTLFAWLIIAILFVTLHYRVHHSFLDYLERGQIARMAELAEVLAQQHEQTRDWSKLLNQPRSWYRALRGAYIQISSRDHQKYEDDDDRHKDDDDEHEELQELKRYHKLDHRRAPPVALLDSFGVKRFGPGRIDEAWIRQPIRVEGVIVAYLAMPPVSQLRTMADLSFLKRQQQSFLKIALLSSLLSAIIAWPLAALLVKPIQRLSLAMQALTERQYDTRVMVAGNDELATAARDFNVMAENLGSYDRRQRQWLADVAHELRTPLSVLQGELEAIQDGVRTADTQSIASLHQEVLGLVVLVEDLRQLSLADIGEQSYQFENVELTELLQQLNQRLQPQLQQQQLSLLIQQNGVPRAVRADWQRLLQALLNLAQNSLRYTDNNGEVRVMVNYGAATASSWSLIWEDSSPGVPEQALTQLFDRMFRVEESRNREQGGSGLGLSIVASIIAAHHGEVAARHSDLGGLLIEIKMPYLVDQA